MAEMYAVTKEQLTDIADAIRLKRDSVEEMTVADMPLQISLIEGGGRQPFVEFSFELAEDFRSTANTTVYYSDIKLTTFEGQKGYCFNAIYDGEWDESDLDMFNETIGVMYFPSMSPENTTNPLSATLSKNGGTFVSSGTINVNFGRDTYRNGNLTVNMRANQGTKYYKAGTYRVRIYDL